MDLVLVSSTGESVYAVAAACALRFSHGVAPRVLLSHLQIEAGTKSALPMPPFAPLIEILLQNTAGHGERAGVRGCARLGSGRQARWARC